MKTALKLVFIYYGMQILSAVLLLIPCYIYIWINKLDLALADQMVTSPSLFVSILFMSYYLWKKGYIQTDRRNWSTVSPSYLALTAIVTFSGIWLLDLLMSVLQIPDLLKESFDLMQAGWVGIIAISLLGPILEELLFRGAITKVLLEKYSPFKAIVISGLIFGIFHLNPAQIVGAGLIGFVLAWVYYRTRSLIPCILIHIINNSLSVYLSLHYPDTENLNSLMGKEHALLITVVCTLLFVGGLFLMHKKTKAQIWKIEEEERR